MKTYKELGFVGLPSEISKFTDVFKDFFNNEWSGKILNNSKNTYLVFNYIGNILPKADVYFCLKIISNNLSEYKLINIIPSEHGQLKIEQYNSILDEIFKIIKTKIELLNIKIEILGPTDDIFNPLDYITQQALDKLIDFCNSANKATGSSHPLDRERWLDFICQTIVDKRKIPSNILYDFLQDPEYWGNEMDDIWSEENAQKLRNEYEEFSEAIEYYQKHYNR